MLTKHTIRNLAQLNAAGRMRDQNKVLTLNNDVLLDILEPIEVPSILNITGVIYITSSNGKGELKFIDEGGIGTSRHAFSMGLSNIRLSAGSRPLFRTYPGTMRSIVMHNCVIDTLYPGALFANTIVMNGTKFIHERMRAITLGDMHGLTLINVEHESMQYPLFNLSNGFTLRGAMLIENLKPNKDSRGIFLIDDYTLDDKTGKVDITDKSILITDGEYSVASKETNNLFVIRTSKRQYDAVNKNHLLIQK